jgi:hypothetical protein
MDLYFLNYKQAIVILTDKSMRLNILSLFEEQQIDVNLKFVDSYLEAATLISEAEHDPFDHVILNPNYSNQKLTDFLDFIKPQIALNPEYLVEYDQKID